MKPTFKPILFRTDMVQAILAGRKTQTRRIVKGFPDSSESINLKDVYDHNANYIYEVCPYGKPGDILWVRETFQEDYHWTQGEGGYVYKADNPPPSLMLVEKWKPSIFMPKAACRIFLKITDVRVERLQDITEDDAVAEGIEKLGASFGYRNYLNIVGLPKSWYSSYHSFQSLWESINGSYSWDNNPWVWVISFERVSKPEGFN